MKLKTALAIAASLAFGTLRADAATVLNTAIVNTALASTQTYTMNITTIPFAGGFNYLSAQAIYSTASVSADSFNDGHVSTGQITVVTNSALGPVSATDQITFPTTTQLTPVSATDYLTIVSTQGMVNNVLYVGKHGDVIANNNYLVATTTGTCQALAAYMNQYYGGWTSTCPFNATEVFSTATAAGSAGNSFQFVSSSPSALTPGGTNFAGGTDSALLNAIITVNGVPYLVGGAWQDTGISSMDALSFQQGVLVPGISFNTGGAVGNNQINVSSTGAPGLIGATISFMGGNLISTVTLTQGVNWTIMGSSAATAISISTAIAANTVLNNLFTATTASAGSTVTVTCNYNGALCNQYIITTSTIALTVSSTGLTSSVFNGGTGSSVVFGTATVSGTAGNSYTLVASTSALAISGAKFFGGQTNTIISIDGVNLPMASPGTFTPGLAWSSGTTSALTASNISSAIITNSFLSTVMVSSNAAGQSVVYATSTIVGNAADFPLSVNTTALSVSGPKFTFSTNTAVNMAANTINLPVHGLATGQQVVLSTGTANFAFDGLVYGTTYYAIVADSNDIGLSLTSSGAVAGVYIVFTSSSIVGPHTFTLTPLAPTGSAYVNWFASNDCNTYFSVATTSVTFQSPYTASTQNWDFGQSDYQCYQAKFVPLATGGANLKIQVIGKQ